MRKASSLVLAGLGAVALTGAAAAASRDVHTMDVPLPDGSVAKIEYVGKVAPKVSVTPAPVAAPFMPFGLFGRSAFDFQRHMDAMMRQIDAMTRTAPAAGAPGLNVAAYGNAPAGSQSVTVVSTSNGAKTCTRTTEVTSQGPGKAPKVVTNVSGLIFERYDKTQTVIPASTMSDSTVKHIQVRVSAKRSGVGVAAATQVIRSAAFTIRNKTS